MSKLKTVAYGIVALFCLASASFAKEVPGSAVPCNTLHLCGSILAANPISECFGSSFPKNAVIFVTCAADGQVADCISDSNTARIQCVTKGDAATGNQSLSNVTTATTAGTVCSVSPSNISAIRWTQPCTQ